MIQGYELDEFKRDVDNLMGNLGKVPLFEDSYFGWKEIQKQDVVIVGGGQLTDTDIDVNNKFIIGTQSSPARYPYNLFMQSDGSDIATHKLEILANVERERFGCQTPIVIGTHCKVPKGKGIPHPVFMIPMLRAGEGAFDRTWTSLNNELFKGKKFITQMGNVVNATLILVKVMMVLGQISRDVEIELVGCDLRYGREGDETLFAHWNEVVSIDDSMYVVDGDIVDQKFMIYEEQMKFLIQTLGLKVKLAHNEESRMRRWL